MSAAEEKLAQQITSSVQAGVSAAAEALNQALDLPVQMEMGDVKPWDPGAPPAEWNADGATFLWQAEAMGVLLLIPESIGLFPVPEASGAWSDEAQSQMTALARSLAQVFGTQEPADDDARAFYASPLQSAIAAAQLSELAVLVSLNLRLEEFTAVAHVVGPVMNPNDVVPTASPERTETAPPPVALPTPNESDGDTKAENEFESGLKQLPGYARSMLRISVPIRVVLAEKKQRLSEVMQIVPGSIIQFDKSCDAVLDLEVANKKVAVGEAVKIDENFGLRVTSICLPDERFRTVGGPSL